MPEIEKESNIKGYKSLLGKIFIIDGASGYLTYNLSKLFLSHGGTIILLGRTKNINKKREEILNNKNISYVNNLDSIPSELKAESIFIHTASSTPNNNFEGYQSIFYENQKLREKTIKNVISSDFKFVINISSMSVYGEIKKEFINEEYRTLPKDLYGLSKLLSEIELNTAIKMTKTKNIIHLRLPGIISKEATGIFVARLFDAVRNDKEITIKSKEALFNNATTAEDIGNTIINFLKLNDQLPKISYINMHSKDNIKIIDLINIISTKLKMNTPEIIYKSEIDVFLIGNLNFSFLLSSSKIKDMLEKIL